MKEKKKGKLTEKYEVGLMALAIVVVGLLVTGITIWPEKGKAVAADALYIRLGNKKPKFKTMSWVSMMFFTGLGAGTVYWAFLEWGYHFNANIQLEGAAVSEAYNYELSVAYAMYDWGPAAWALLCIFVLPFAYHHYVKKDSELKLSALCKYTVGEKAAKGWFGKIVPRDGSARSLTSSSSLQRSDRSVLQQGHLEVRWQLRSQICLTLNIPLF